MAKRTKETVECEGRFSDLRAFLYNHAFPVVLDDRRSVTDSDLKSIWKLIQEDAVSGVLII